MSNSLLIDEPLSMSYLPSPKLLGSTKWLSFRLFIIGSTPNSTATLEKVIIGLKTFPKICANDSLSSFWYLVDVE